MKTPQQSTKLRALPVLCRRDGTLGLIELRRTTRLNALNQDMLQRMRAALQAWRHAPDVRAVLIRGADATAFCAGGDVRELAEAPLASGPFFDGLYDLAETVATYPKPIVTLLNGVGMGAGLGLAMLANHSVVGSRAWLAMPETMIGHLPDTGGTWTLPRLPDRAGVCLALTGWRVGPGDAVHLGLVDGHVPSGQQTYLEASLKALPRTESPDVNVRRAIERVSAPIPAGPLTRIRARMRTVFGYRRYAEIRAALRREDRPWAWAALRRIEANAPTAVKVTLDAMESGARSSLPDCLQLERALTGLMVTRSDFQEGVRARLLDKDKAPAWQPDRFGSVPDDTVSELICSEAHKVRTRYHTSHTTEMDVFDTYV